RSVCLAEPAGDARLDVEIRKQQERVRGPRSKPEAWVELGRQWVRKARGSSDAGFYVNAGACAAAALEAEPGFSPALGLRSLVLMNDHKFEQAREVAESILQHDPADVLALGTLSDALLELGRYEESAAASQRQM